MEQEKVVPKDVEQIRWYVEVYNFHNIITTHSFEKEKEARDLNDLYVSMFKHFNVVIFPKTSTHKEYL